MKQDHRELFSKEWSQIYNSKDSKFILVGNVESYKSRSEGTHHVIFNKTYAKKDLALIQLAHQKKTVFIPFDPVKFNYSNISNKQVMFHVNLDEQEIISKENAYKITEKFFDKDQDDENDQIEGHAHPILINTGPLCRNHSILVMYPDEELPQIVGQDIALLLLNLFKIFPGIIIGYNSIGASSSVNHLHFHLLYPQDLIGAQKLPIEKVPRKIWKKSTLINPQEEINLYSVGVVIEEFDEGMGQGLVLSAFGQNLQASEVASSLAFVFGTIANELIELCIPHNIVFTDDGNTIFIIVREFGSEKCSYGWLEFAGVIPAASENQFAIKQEDILHHKQGLRVDANLIHSLKKNIAKSLECFI